MRSLLRRVVNVEAINEGRISREFNSECVGSERTGGDGKDAIVGAMWKEAKEMCHNSERIGSERMM